MNWVDIAWPLLSGVCLTLGGIYFLIWWRQRQKRALLVFSVAAFLVCATGLLEMASMHARSPEGVAAALRPAHVAVVLMVASLAAYARLQFRAGIRWLAMAAVGLRVAVMVPALALGDTARFGHILRLQRVALWGGAEVSLPVASPNPVGVFIGIADALLVLFFASVIVQVRRRTADPVERRHVLAVCGSLMVSVTLATSWATLIGLGVVRAPFFMIFFFMSFLLVIAYDLGGSVIRATGLEMQLRDTETHLRGSEERLQLTAEAVGMGLWTWNMGNGEVWFNDTGNALLGLDKDVPFDRESFFMRVHADDRDAIVRAGEIAQGSGRYECEYRLGQSDGAMRWVAALGRIDHSGPSAPVMRGVIIDITERRQAEERFRLVVEGSPTAMLMVDADGRIALANAQAAHLFGYARDELLGQAMDKLVTFDLRTDHPRHRDADPRSAQPRHQKRAHRKDGSEVRVEVTRAPVYIGEDRLVLASVTDISERLRIEQEVAIQREELAHLSRISLLGEMSASLAHELNQPLTAVLSNAQAALRFLDRETPDLDEVRQSLHHIVENDKRAGEVIRRLRAMLRKEQIDYQPLVVNEVVHDVLRLLSSDLVNRDVSTRLDLAEDLPLVLGDRVQMQQVLLNLIVNACDAMASMAGDRVVSLRTRLADESHLEIAVADIGPGIPAADLERIFTPFVTTKPQGMGLGLAVCRTILEAHHGTLHATNAADGGAKMVVRLPLLASETTTSEAAEREGATVRA
jgi:PAS domain S-box-containing protein